MTVLYLNDKHSIIRCFVQIGSGQTRVRSGVRHFSLIDRHGIVVGPEVETVFAIKVYSFVFHGPFNVRT